MRLALACLTLAACGPDNHVAPFGTVSFPIASAHLTVDPGTFGADDLLTVTLSSLEASCDAERAFRDAAAVADSPEEMAAAWSSAYPESFFEVDVVARIKGGTWPPSGTLWSGLDWDALPEQNNLAFALITGHITSRDVDYWSGEAEEVAAYEKIWLTDGGLMRWGAATPGLRVSGQFNTAVVDEAGNEVGNTEIRFDATVCGL